MNILNKMDHLPKALFVYNLLAQTKQTIEDLQTNDLAMESKIFTYCNTSERSNNIAITIIPILRSPEQSYTHLINFSLKN